jgi:hypothetical protein
MRENKQKKWKDPGLAPQPEQKNVVNFLVRFSNTRHKKESAVLQPLESKVNKLLCLQIPLGNSQNFHKICSSKTWIGVL